MEEQLKALFEFQRFAQEDALAALIRETEARYGAAEPGGLAIIKKAMDRQVEDMEHGRE